MNTEPIELEQLFRERAQRIRGRGTESETSSGDPYLMFRVQQCLCALPVGEVETLLKIPAIRSVPGMPPAYLGVFELRGHFQEAFCLETLLGGNKPTGRHLLLLRTEQGTLGLRVGEVKGIRNRDPAEWKPLSGSDWPVWICAAGPDSHYLISTSLLLKTLYNI